MRCHDLELDSDDKEPATLDKPEPRPSAFRFRMLQKPPPGRFAQEDTFDALKAFRDWEPCWLRAVGLAWSKPALKAALIANPHKFLLEQCNYKVPPTLRINVREDLSSNWDDHPDDKTKFLWKLRPTELTLYLPEPPPKGKEKDWVVALADYDAVGSFEPFTFCC
jgi:ribosomally synthesized peptide (two-chain TOMM family)